MALAITVPILVLIDQAIKIVISRRFFDHGFSILITGSALLAITFFSGQNIIPIYPG